MKDLLFAAVDLRDKPCTIIGGGAVAERKAKRLAMCGALVTVVAPSITGGIEMLARGVGFSIMRRAYQKGDLSSAFLAVIATNDTAVNMEALSEAKELGILTNAAFDKKHGNIFFSATKEMDGYTISVMTKDKSPKKSIEILENVCTKKEIHGNDKICYKKQDGKKDV